MLELVRPARNNWEKSLSLFLNLSRKPKKVDEDSIEKAPQEALEEDLKANGPSTSENSLAESDRTTDTHL